MGDLCPHDDDPATCPPCRRAAGKDSFATSEGNYGPVFDASYEGQCPGCNLPIRWRDKIRAVLSRDGVYVHATCEMPHA